LKILKRHLIYEPKLWWQAKFSDVGFSFFGFGLDDVALDNLEYNI
jgi:hypothetical protein